MKFGFKGFRGDSERNSLVEKNLDNVQNCDMDIEKLDSDMLHDVENIDVECATESENIFDDVVDEASVEQKSEFKFFTFGRRFYSTTCKIIASMLFVFTIIIAVACFVGGAFMIDEGLYERTENQILADGFKGQEWNVSFDVASLYLNYYEDAASFIDDYVEDTNVAIYLRDGDFEYRSENFGIAEEVKTYSHSLQFIDYFWAGESENLADNFKLTVTVDESLPYDDTFSWIAFGVAFVCAMRYVVFPLGVMSALVAICLFTYLLCAAGRNPYDEKIVAGAKIKMPLDLYTLITGGLAILPIIFADFLWNEDILFLVYCALAVIYELILFIAYVMNVATRVKTGVLFSNTIIFILAKFIWNCCGKFVKGFVVCCENLGVLWKTLFGILIFDVVALFAIAANEVDNQLLLLLAFNVVFLPVALKFALSLSRLHKASQSLADGDLSYRVNVRGMVGDMKQSGENLNSISEGLNLAVEERLKSERFKTELITNVSHDIKTPLTSIINYVDLIGKEDVDNPKVVEYVEILERQSKRLKKLIEDLVSASKASTGNEKVNFEPVDVGVLASQTLGEYEHKFAAENLAVVCRQSVKDVYILADGRLLWRVFDNLFSNAYKYSQSGTRVYLTIEEVGDEVLISFKNTSKYPLDIDAELLMERFVRGDMSRHSEGSGLGLSIAKSLTELQNGDFDISVDGDLFKATLKFKILK